MTFQVNAMFDDGHIVQTDYIHQPTPAVDDCILVARQGDIVPGRVICVRQIRAVLPGGRAELIDEVQVRQAHSNDNPAPLALDFH